MDDCQLAAVPEWFQPLQLRMQRETAIEVDGCVLSSWSRYRNGRPNLVIPSLGERNDDVQSVGRASLKNRNENLAPSLGRSGCASKPAGRDTESGHHDSRRLDEVTSCNHGLPPLKLG